MTTRAPSLRISTFKKGLLSRLGHDLRLQFDSFELELDGSRLVCSVELESLRVLGAVRDGGLDSSAISASDREKIRRSALDEVLEVRRFARARFEGTVVSGEGAPRVEGELELHGRRRALPRVELEGGETSYRARFTLTPSRWGIAPYRALAGALKLEDRVDVDLEVPLVEGVEAGSGRHTWRSDGR